ENQYLLSGTALSNLKRWTLAATSTVSTGMLKYQQYALSIHRKGIFSYGLNASYLQSNYLTSWSLWAFGGMAWWTIGTKWEFYSLRGHRIWIPLQAKKHFRNITIVGSVEPGVHIATNTIKPILQLTLQIRHQWELALYHGK
ncbi:MAG: hypothetical protein GXO48_08000, partial [Chlorobi bacterium]|nr:hypothetical protein [Chlorobiota bacterium]